MKQKSTTLIILFVLSIHSISFTQSILATKKIRARVISYIDNEPLVGATISVVELSMFFVTDRKGWANIELPYGTYTLEVSYVGYETNEMPGYKIGENSLDVVQFRMKLDTELLRQMDITAEEQKSDNINEMTVLSARQFAVKEAGRYAGSLTDVGRMIKNFAGVASSGDENTNLVVRGNSPLGMLWRLEGMDISSPSHFSSAGTNGGGVSIINQNVLANSDFISGAFSSEYGNALSGVFDMKLRNGNSTEYKHAAILGAIGLEVMSEGPISKNNNGSYLFHYRYSTVALLTNVLGIDVGSNSTSYYQDAAFKLRFPTDKAGTFSLFGIGGTSSHRVDYDQNEDDDFTGSRGDSTNYLLTSNMGAAGLSHIYFFKDNQYIKTVLGVTANAYSNRLDSVSPTLSEIPYQLAESTFLKWMLHSSYIQKIGEYRIFKTGVIFSNPMYRNQFSSYDYENNEITAFQNISNNSNVLQLYGNWKEIIREKWTLSSGVFYQRFGLNGGQSVEPRAAIAYQLSNKQQINFGYGLHSQLQPLPFYFVETLENNEITYTNQDLDFSKSHHFVLGYHFDIKKSLRAKIETYYQSLFNIPIHEVTMPSTFSMLNEGGRFSVMPQPDLVNEGLGRNYGLEFTLEHFLQNGFYGLLTTSLYQSEYLASDGIWRNTAFSGNYVVNLLAGKSWNISDRSSILLDIKTSFAGGQRYTPINLEASKLAEMPVYVETAAFSEQYRPYQRTDVKIAYHLKGKKINHEIFFNVDNVFNIENVLTEVYNPKVGDLVTINQFGRLPTFQWKIIF